MITWIHRKRNKFEFHLGLALGKIGFTSRDNARFKRDNAQISFISSQSSHN